MEQLQAQVLRETVFNHCKLKEEKKTHSWGSGLREQDVKILKIQFKDNKRCFLPKSRQERETALARTRSDGSSRQ